MSLERERKYAVPPEFAMPPSVGEVGETVRLISTYFDTADHALLKSGVTLRRREGDADVGWQLKVPAGEDAREEIARRLTRRPPPALLDLLAGLLDGRPLAEVARIETQRQVVPAREEDVVIALVAVDDVQATNVATSAPVAWREVEVELTDAGQRRHLDEIEAVIVDAGAYRATAPSKLARTLGWRSPALSAADAVVSGYLADSVQRLVAGDIALRRGHGDVHQIRVAVRRVRSVLRVFAPMLAETTLVDDLSPYQDQLGEVRDHEVQRRHFDAATASLAVELALGPVAATIDEQLLGEQQRAAAHLRAALDTPAHRATFHAALTLVNRPLTRPGTRVADLERLARRARRRAAKRMRHANDDVALHRARKAMKRARYAAELIGAKPKTIKRYKRLQDVLGEHQDAVVAAEFLLQLARRFGPRSGHNAFAYGVLYQRELATASERRAAAERLR